MASILTCLTREYYLYAAFFVTIYVEKGYKFVALLFLIAQNYQADFGPTDDSVWITHYIIEICLLHMNTNGNFYT